MFQSPYGDYFNFYDVGDTEIHADTGFQSPYGDYFNFYWGWIYAQTTDLVVSVPLRGLF